MKARIKATGEIVEVEDCGSVFRHGALFHGYKGANDIKYLPDEIELQMDFDYLEACHDETPDSPDYWTRLEHTYAGMAMHSILQTMPGVSDPDKYMKAAIDLSAKIATALVEKMKENEKAMH